MARNLELYAGQVICTFGLNTETSNFAQGTFLSKQKCIFKSTHTLVPFSAGFVIEMQQWSIVSRLFMCPQLNATSYLPHYLLSFSVRKTWHQKLRSGAFPCFFFYVVAMKSWPVMQSHNHTILRKKKVIQKKLSYLSDANSSFLWSLP